MDSGKPSYEALEARLHQLEEVVQECERLSVASRYAAAIMHEVNNPLEALTNLTYLLKQDPLPDDAMEKLHLMDEQIAVLTAVTRPSLSFHKDHRSSKEMDLVALVSSVQKLHGAKATNAGLKIQTRCPEKALCSIVGSEMLQVLSNLLLNAMDAMSRVKLGKRINIRVRRTRTHVCLFIADDGPGIPEHLEGRLFEPYATGKDGGTGLGLWISKRIIESHQGMMRCRTCRREGRSGTAFRILMPCM